MVHKIVSAQRKTRVPKNYNFILITTKEFSLTRGEIIGALTQLREFENFRSDYNTISSVKKRFDEIIREINDSIRTNPDIKRTKERIIETIAESLTPSRSHAGASDPTIASETRYHGYLS